MKVRFIWPSPPPYVGFWCNKNATCLPFGAIVDFLASLESDLSIVIPYGDGLREDDMDNSRDYAGHAEDAVLGVHCYREPIALIRNRLLCLPLDDDIFELGLRQVLRLEGIDDVPWEAKRSLAYWRGNGDLRSTHNPRVELVQRLHDNPLADVKFVRTPHTPADQWPTQWFDQRFTGDYQPVPLAEFAAHKYVFIVDNFIITSGLQVVFGLGSVPLLVCHPNHRFWFRDLLKPMVNFVPVDVGLGDLEEKLQWLADNDDAARAIAAGARELSDLVFSPQFQRDYLASQLQRQAAS
jgi:hypothetical protein